MKTLDISTSLTFFFKLKDWKRRILYIGVIPTFTMLFFSIGIFLSLIPITIILRIIGGIVILFAALISILHQVYVLGYLIEIMISVSKNQSIEKINVSKFTSKRLKRGGKVMLAQQIYNLPVILVSLLSYFLIFSPIIFINTTDEENPLVVIFSIIAILVFIIIMIISSVYQMFYATFIFPSSIYSFITNESFKSLFNFKLIKSFIKYNWKNLIYFTLILIGMGMIFNFIYMINYFLIFLCIGIFLLPIILSVGSTYIGHTIAHILGQIYKIHNSKVDVLND